MISGKNGCVISTLEVLPELIFWPKVIEVSRETGLKPPHYGKGNRWGITEVALQ